MGNEQSGGAGSAPLDVRRRESSTAGGAIRCPGDIIKRGRRLSSCTELDIGDNPDTVMKLGSDSPQRPGSGSQSPRHTAFRASRHHSQHQILAGAPGLTSRVGTTGHHLLSPSPAGGVCRNRRMSVAGDQQDSLRRELARAEGGGPGAEKTGPSSGGGTPLRRYSRATTGGSHTNGATVMRKISEVNSGGGGSSSAEPTAMEQIKLSNYQTHILQQSWPRIRSSAVLAHVFRDLAHKNAAVKEMFQKMSIVDSFCAGASKSCDQKEHARQLVELVDFALQNLNGPCRILQQKCHSLGEQHFTAFGASNEAHTQLWDDLGECISQAIAKAEPVRGKREAFRAWITLVNFLVESMRAGYVQLFKRKSLSRHSSSSQMSVVQLATLNELSPTADGPKRALTPTAPLSALQL